MKTQKAHAAAMFAEFSCEFSSSLATEKKGWLELFGRSLNILVKWTSMQMGVMRVWLMKYGVIFGEIRM